MGHVIDQALVETQSQQALGCRADTLTFQCLAGPQLCRKVYSGANAIAGLSGEEFALDLHLWIGTRLLGGGGESLIQVKVVRLQASLVRIPADD